LLSNLTAFPSWYSTILLAHVAAAVINICMYIGACTPYEHKIATRWHVC